MNNTVEIPRELFDQLLAYFNKSLWESLPTRSPRI